MCIRDRYATRDGRTLIQIKVEDGSHHFKRGERLYFEPSSVRRIPRAPIDPLDVEYDGWTLRKLLYLEEKARHDNVVGQAARSCFTPAQRAAVAAHWSAEPRAKVAAGPSLDGSTYGQRLARERRERDRARVLVDLCLLYTSPSPR